MLRARILSSSRKRVLFAIAAVMMIAGLALVPNTVAFACAGTTGSCYCPGC